MSIKKVQSALISVYHKDNLEPIIRFLHQHEVTIYSTGGTYAFIEELGVPVVAVEDVTGYPSIFGGRVKTLHPKVFGGILNRRSDANDASQAKAFDIPMIDLVIVDLYPFEDTVASTDDESAIIEKIDIGGISLIRAAAKNYQDVVIVSSRSQYEKLLNTLQNNAGGTTLAERKHFAAMAFDVSSHYDSAIFNYFNQTEAIPSLKISAQNAKTLRYGENPHQKGFFHGNLEEILTQHHGKEISYNNLVDIDAAIKLIHEFGGETAFAIIKHTNACGVAVGKSVSEAYELALAADPVSAFGGVLVTNQKLTPAAAELINSLFFEVLIAPDYASEALTLLKSKKNRILLTYNGQSLAKFQYKSLLNGTIRQEADLKTDTSADLTYVTEKQPTAEQVDTLLFASKIAKHTKSNTIVLAKDGRMLASGVGQTSRVDALHQAIKKAKSFNFSLEGAVMASDAFFPFPDCVEIAHGEGITSVIQPGGSIKDQASIDYCNKHGLSMVFTGIRHFYH